MRIVAAHQQRLGWLMPVLIACALVGSVLVPTSEPAAAQRATATAAVVPIKWARFQAGPPPGGTPALARSVLLNTNRYALVTWYPDTYGSQPGDYLDLDGTGEQNIRPPASEALALATSLATGAYDAARTGVDESTGRRIAVRLLTSVAHTHRATTASGWGATWQSALWAYYAGKAGWLLWNHLTGAERAMLADMIVYEADRFIRSGVPYHRDSAGGVVFRGDSKAEENSWNAQLLQLATAMMPRHPHWRSWMNRNIELLTSAFASVSDVQNTRVVNGMQVRDWIAGSNIADDGTLVNHNRIHPDYMATVAMMTSAPLSYGLAGMATPEAARHNADIVYAAMTDVNFPAPPYDPPGGALYMRAPDGSATPDIYYPQGNDWGTSRRMHFALLDAQADLFGYGDGTRPSPADWEAEHLGMVRDMQARFTDGRTYGDNAEDTYAGREQWVALQAAETYLTHWLDHQGAVRFTNRRFFSVPPNATVFATDPTTGSLLQADASPGRWTSWNEVATTGRIASYPAVVYHPNGEIHVFGTASNHAVYTTRFAPGSGWTAWTKLGGETRHAPTAIYRNGHLDVYITGIDGTVYQTHNQTGSWVAWYPIAVSGTIDSAPAAVAKPGGAVAVVGKGTGGSVRLASYTPGAGWSDWRNLGGETAFAPAAVDVDGRMNVFVTAPDGTLHRAHEQNGRWTEWHPVAVSGRLDSPPAVLSWPSGAIDIFGTRRDRFVHHTRYEAAHGWSPWRRHFDGAVIGTPAATRM